MKRRWIWITVILLLAVSAIVCSDTKGMAVNHVLRHEEQVRAHALAYMKQPDEVVPYRSWEVRYDTVYGVVQFQVQYTGFASQADELGFYYAPENLACGLGNGPDREDWGNGVKFIGNGDNYTYVEKISDHWYWYDMHG